MLRLNSLVHIPVLVSESLELLDLQKGMFVVDATVGLGGHAEQFLSKIVPSGRLLGIDADGGNLSYAQQQLQRFGSCVSFYHGNYSEIKQATQQFQFSSCDAIFFDLGLASPHVDVAQRGFSFKHDGPVDMRFDTSQKLTAAYILNFYSFDNLVRIFRHYGQEPLAVRIAKRIVETRRKSPFKTTFQLVDVISSVKRVRKGIHPATKVFQALRMEVNRELEHLQQALIDAIGLLKVGGRMVVISYHSLEDRIVKNVFRFHARSCICPLEVLQCECSGKPTLKILTRKPITPSSQEVMSNPRSRSAKMRGVERVGE